MTADTRAQQIRARLSEALNPTTLDVVDEGWQHVGHAEEGAGHFAIRIASPKFKDQPLRACHEMVYAALGDAMEKDIHALRIRIQRE